MSKRAIVVSCVLLVGCTTTVREIRQHEPRATYTSARSSAALEACIAGSLSWAGTPAIVHGEGFTELAFGSGGSTAVLVSLKPQAAGTEIEVRELLAYGRRVRNNVEACATGRDQ